MQKNRIKIDLLGRSFTVLCDEKPEHLKEVMTTLRRRIDQISSRVSTNDPLKTALLAGFDLVDEVIKLREVLKRRQVADPVETEEIRSITENLIQRIDDCLIDP